MPRLLLALLGLALIRIPVLAQESSEPASEALVRQLLEETNVRAMLDQLIPQIQSMTRGSIDQALAGHPITPEERKIIQRLLDKTTALIKEELSWEKLEPFYIEIYRSALTDEEVQGMIDFYRTPAGQAVLKKLPAVTQRTMEGMQKLMGPMMQKLERIQNDTMAELVAAKSPLLEP